MTQYQFIQAHWYHRGRRGHNGDRRIHGAVAHSMEAPEKGTTAEATARYFANGSGGRPSSADWCFDDNSGVECVKPTDEAYHAPPISWWTRGYEHAGYARQSAADWRDPFSMAMLQRSGEKLGEESRLYQFPLRYLTIADLKRGWVDGVTMHNDASKAFGKSTHWDPGPGFPMEYWLQVAEHGAHTVAPVLAGRALKIGMKGGDVLFWQQMTNILILAGLVKAEGLAIEDGGFGVKSRTAAIAAQHFFNAMLKMSGNPKRVRTDGVIDHDTLAAYVYWVPEANKIIQKKLLKR